MENFEEACLKFLSLENNKFLSIYLNEILYKLKDKVSILSNLIKLGYGTNGFSFKLDNSN